MLKEVKANVRWKLENLNVETPMMEIALCDDLAMMLFQQGNCNEELPLGAAKNGLSKGRNVA